MNKAEKKSISNIEVDFEMWYEGNIQDRVNRCYPEKTDREFIKAAVRSSYFTGMSVGVDLREAENE